MTWIAFRFAVHQGPSPKPFLLLRQTLARCAQVLPQPARSLPIHGGAHLHKAKSEARFSRSSRLRPPLVKTCAHRAKRLQGRIAPSRTANCFRGQIAPSRTKPVRYVRIRLRLRLVFLGELSKSPGRSQPRARTGVLGQLGGSHIGRFCPRRCDFPGEGTPRYPPRHHTSSRIAATISLSSSGGSRKSEEVKQHFARQGDQL